MNSYSKKLLDNTMWSTYRMYHSANETIDLIRKNRLPLDRYSSFIYLYANEYYFLMISGDNYEVIL